MSIAGIETVGTNENDSAVSQGSILDKDDFLLLLVAQLKAQDPLKPMDSTQFTAQLAQFSSLEQLYNVNDNLEYLQLYQASLNNSQAVSLIGKSIRAAGNAIAARDGIADPMHFALASDADGVFVSIYDSTGALVRSIEHGGLDAGEQTIQWDGMNNDGTKVPDGIYTFEIMAIDENENVVDTTTFTIANVTGITFKNGIVYLVAGTREIPIGDVVEVTESDSQLKDPMPGA
jgi:flagellar basal-body rod modification protein FlgD